MKENSLETTLIRTLPANIQAEQMLLGAILINHNCLYQVLEFLKSEHFYEVLHQKIYNSICLITEKGLMPTPITVHSYLNNDPTFQQSGGTSYLSRIATLALMVINARDYGKIIYDLAMKRNLIEFGEEVVNTAYDSTLAHSASDQIAQAEAKLFNLASEGINERSFVKIADTLSASLVNIDRAMKNSDHVVGISSGFTALDTTLSGFHNSDLIIVAGRPSMGKTAFAIALAVNSCKALQAKHKRQSNNDDKEGNGEKEGSAVGIFSLEMSSEQLAYRILSMQTHIDSSVLRSGKMKEESYNSLVKAATELRCLPIFIDDTPALSISAIRTRARKLKQRHNLGMLFVDYLQLIHGVAKSDNRVQEISEITRGLKAIAKELNVPVVALSQLSRAVEAREDKRPMLADLRESGTIEQDADIVMFIYRHEYYLMRSEPPPGDAKHAEWQNQIQKVHNIADIIIAKHRNGPTGTVQLFYDTKYSKFNNLDKLHI